MYARRIQLTSYGPIDHVDIHFPFRDDGMPKPVVLVGENGSGKSILLSHIVDGLVMAKGVTYPKNPEVETGQVYKIRSNAYIKAGHEYCFARVDFADGLFMAELQAHRTKGSYGVTLHGITGTDAEQSWDNMKINERIVLNSSFDPGPLGSQPIAKQQIDANIAKRCVLYFPANRFEEPAWLNAANLTALAQHERNPRPVFGETHRRIIADSALRENQNWLFGLAYDAAINLMKKMTALTIAGHRQDTSQEASLHLSPDRFSERDVDIYVCTLDLLRQITRRPKARFVIGNRKARLVQVFDGHSRIVPNVFQLSSGETALLNLGLSILRDYDACDEPFADLRDVRGIVVIDEIDLHLHVHHQSDVLPRLIEMFPGVQFIVTSHSPLFVLGMRNTFGDDGFDIYRLPDGHQINAEEFSEFGEAYQAFATSKQFVADVRQRVLNAQRPILWVEGTTDEQYLRAAAAQLDQSALLDRFELRDAGGAGKLRNIWTALGNLTNSPAGDMIQQVVILLHDPEYQGEPENKGRVYKRKMHPKDEHPISKGIENLFDRRTLEWAKDANPAFIDVDFERTRLNRGKRQTFPEKWDVNSDEKKNLCDWLCQNGDESNFQHFKPIFAMLEEVLRLADESG